jgi:hypothetical protein
LRPKEDESWENIVAMYAQVKDIDDEHGLVYLKCKYKKDSDEIFERIFPLKHFKRQNDRTIGSGKLFF